MTTNNSTPQTGTWRVKVGLAQMLGCMANGLEAGAVGIHILTR